jgi:hypothetical protein
MKLPRVLLATPTASVKDYCLKEWASYVKSLTYPNLDIFLIDNSLDPEHYKVILKHGLNCVPYIRTKGQEPRDFMTECSNIIRDKVINEKYDFLMSLESDIFTHPNIIEHLLSFRKNVVGLSYFIQQTYFSRLIPFEIEDFGFLRITQTTPQDKAFMSADGKLKPVYQLGLGCILIHRSVLEKIKFRYDINDGELRGNADVYFHNDCMEKGIQTFCDWGHFCYHENGNWMKIYRNFEQEKV